MAKQNKFERMLELLVNEDKQAAEELFHEIVVEHSREIYKSLIENDLNDFDLDEAGMGGDPADKMVGDVKFGDDDDMDDEDMDMDDEDMDMDMDDEDEDSFDVGDSDDMEDKIDDLSAQIASMAADLERAVSSLKDEDEDMDNEDMDMDDEDMDMDDDDEDEDMDMDDDDEDEDMDMDDDDEDESDDEDDDMPKVGESRQHRSAGEEMREYVEKVSTGHGAEKRGSGESGNTYTKSPVAGKNDMGGKSSNLVQGGEADAKGTKGGLADPSAKEESMGNVNVPGGKASKSQSKMSKGHGSEKKGGTESATNKRSTLGSR